MDLKKILAYQEIDKKIYQLEMELRQSKSAQEYAKAMSVYKAKNEEMMKCLRDANEIVVIVDRYRRSFELYNNEVNGLSEVLDSFEELKEIDKYEKKINGYMKDLQSAEKDLFKMSNKMDECIEVSKKALQDLVKLENIIMTRRQDMQKLKNLVDGKAKEYVAELKKLQSELPADFIQKYAQIRKNKKMPVLVPSSDNYKSCMGCGMDLSNELSIKLQAKQIIECPNCGRLIYNAN